MRFYIAGPLFTPYERKLVEDIAGMLRLDGHSSYIPHAEGFLVSDLAMAFKDYPVVTDPHGLSNEIVSCLDIYHLIKRCQSCIYIGDGRAPDEGAVSEIAIAWSMGMRIFGYKNDPRRLVENYDNPLVTSLLVGGEYSETLESLRQCIQSTISDPDMTSEIKALEDRVKNIGNSTIEKPTHLESVDEIVKTGSIYYSLHTDDTRSFVNSLLLSYQNGLWKEIPRMKRYLIENITQNIISQDMI